MSNRKNRPPKRPRQHRVQGTTKENVTEIEVTIDPVTGEVSFGQAMVNTYNETFYERTKKEKALSRIPGSTPISFDPYEVLCKGYVKIFAVDTSTFFVDAKKVCLTPIVSSSINRAADAAVFSWGVARCYLYMRPLDNPERFGWSLLIDELQKNDDYRTCSGIAIVVDSDLSIINDINAGSIPVCVGGARLPANMRLVFASDAASENAENVLIRAADRATVQVRDRLLAGKTDILLQLQVGQVARIRAQNEAAL